MGNPSALRDAGLFAALGALSGVVCAVFPMFEALNVSLGWTGLFSSRGTAPLLPGVFFGLVLAALIYFLYAAEWLRAMSGILTSVVAWVIAVHVAQEFRDLWAGGLVAGAVGAAITGAGIALIMPSYRSAARIALTVIVGALAGLLLLLIDSDASVLSLLPLYVGWQSTVAASIAYAIARHNAIPTETALKPAAG